VLLLGTIEGDATVSLMVEYLRFRKMDQKITLFSTSVDKNGVVLFLISVDSRRF
jgi:hypothetical protein